jgi:hypothetical protein
MDWKGCSLSRGTNLSGGKEEHEITPLHCLTPGSRFEHGIQSRVFTLLTATIGDIRHMHKETKLRNY